MRDLELAQALVTRLNALLQGGPPDVREALQRLIDTRVNISEELSEHPTIQCSMNPEGSSYCIGFLGVLNGLVGTQSEGNYTGWGYIAANYDETTNDLLGFEVLDSSSKIVVLDDGQSN